MTEALNKESLIAEFAPRVRAMAGQLRRDSKVRVPVEDLVQIGYVGLLEAYDRYDPSLGVPFPGFAHYRVHGAMIDALQNHTGVSRRSARRLARMDAANDYMSSVTETFAGQDTEDDDFAFINAAVRGVSTAMSLSDLVEGEVVDSEAHKAVDDVDFVAKGELARDLVSELLDSLNDQEAELVRLHYFKGIKLTRVADQMELSRSWVSRVHTRAIQRMLSLAEARGLDFEKVLDLL